MRRLLILFCCILLFLLALPAAAQSGPSFETFPCPFMAMGNYRVECGTVQVPENRADPSSRTIKLAVAVFRGSGPAADPVFYLEGGPGGHSVGVMGPVFPFVALRDLLEGRDVVLFDQRGVGLSTPNLDCTELTELSYAILDQQLSFEESDALSSAALLDCRERLVSEGVDLRFYNSAASAADINDIRLALGYEQINLYGISYGTRLALTTMRDYPQILRSVVLDSVYPPEASLVEAIVNADRAFSELYAACAADAACSAAVPDLRTLLFATVESLNAEPVMLEVTALPGGGRYDVLLTGDVLLSSLFSSMYQTTIIPTLPQMLLDISAGNYDGIRLLLGLFVELAKRISYGMYTSVQCAEEMPFTTQEEAALLLEQYSDYRAAAGSLAAPGIFAACAAWGLDAPDPIENLRVESDIPTLLISGGLDPITPPAWADSAALGLPNSHVYTVAGGGHGSSLTESCPGSLVAAFLDNPSAAPDASCLDEIVVRFSMAGDAVEIELESFSSTNFGLTGLRPAGWNEPLSGSGSYVRGSSGLDQTAIVIQAAPGTPQALLGLLTTQLQLSATPESTGTHAGQHLAWMLYELTVQGYPADLALASAGTRTVLVLLVSNTEGERPDLYEQVFLPVLDALLPTR